MSDHVDSHTVHNTPGQVSTGRMPDLLDRMAADHRDTDGLFARIKALPRDDPRRRRLTGQVIAVLDHHCADEARFLDPLLHRMPGGPALAREEDAARGRLQELVSGLASARHRRGDIALNRLLFALNEHTDRQASLFRLLRGSVSADELVRLGHELRAAHPTASQPDLVPADSAPSDRLVPAAAEPERTSDQPAVIE